MIYIIDTETTGIVEPKATEIAYRKYEATPYGLNHIKEFYQRFNPGKPISLGASATTHIFDEDVENESSIDTFVFPEDCQYMIAHNVDYDWEVLGKPDVKRICTLALSRYLFPDLELHTQTAMLYHFHGSSIRDKVINAHNALVDIINLTYLWWQLVDTMVERDLISIDTPMEEIYQLSELARIPTKMSFGKHKGTAITDVPADYMAWYLRQEDKDEYYVIAFNKELERRNGKSN